MFAALSMIVASMAVFGLAHAKEDPINLFIQPGISLYRYPAMDRNLDQRVNG